VRNGGRRDAEVKGTYKIICGHVDIRSDDFFELRSKTTTRGNPYKLFKRRCACTVRSSFSTDRVVNISNCLPSRLTVDFSSLIAFKCVEFNSDFFNFTWLFACWYYEFDVCSSYVFIFFSMVTVSAVLQPCRTCRMLSVLARCAVCVLGK